MAFLCSCRLIDDVSHLSCVAFWNVVPWGLPRPPGHSRVFPRLELPGIQRHHEEGLQGADTHPEEGTQQGQRMGLGGGVSHLALESHPLSRLSHLSPLLL